MLAPVYNSYFLFSNLTNRSGIGALTPAYLRHSAEKVMPRLGRSAFSGEMRWRSNHELFTEHPSATTLFADILADRGFGVAHEVRAIEIGANHNDLRKH